jgi:hypothetical protein
MANQSAGDSTGVSSASVKTEPELVGRRMDTSYSDTPHPHEITWEYGHVSPDVEEWRSRARLSFGYGVFISHYEIDGLTDEQIAANLKAVAYKAARAEYLAHFEEFKSKLLDGEMSECTYDEAADLSWPDYWMRPFLKRSSFAQSVMRLSAYDHEKALNALLEKHAPNLGYIYILSDGCGNYKIGRTAKLDQRIKQLAIQLPYKVYVAMAFRVVNSVYYEQKLHHWYQDKRTNGEWFKLDDGDLDEIRQHGHLRTVYREKVGQPESQSLALVRYEGRHELVAAGDDFPDF